MSFDHHRETVRYRDNSVYKNHGKQQLKQTMSSPGTTRNQHNNHSLPIQGATHKNDSITIIRIIFSALFSRFDRTSRKLAQTPKNRTKREILTVSLTYLFLDGFF